MWNCTKWLWKIQPVCNKGTSNCICSYHLHKRRSWGHSGCSAVGWNGKGCDDWQPFFQGSQLVQNRTGNVLAKLLLTCCPIRDRGETQEVFKKRGIHTNTHHRATHTALTVTSVRSQWHTAKQACTVYVIHCRLILRQTLSWLWVLYESDNKAYTDWFIN